MNFFRKNFDLLIFPAAILALAVTLYLSGIARVPYLELSAALLLITARSMQKREMPTGLVISIVGNATLVYYFALLNLPGQIALCTFAIIMNDAALYSWLVPNTKTHKIIRPTFLHPLLQAAIVLTVAALAAFGAITRGTIGALDYFTMTCGIIGIILLVRKKTECWAMYTAGDSGGIALFWLTGSYLMMATVFIYIYTDISAFFRWRTEFRKLKKK